MYTLSLVSVFFPFILDVYIVITSGERDDDQIAGSGKQDSKW